MGCCTGYYRNERKRLELESKYTRRRSLELNDWITPAICGLGMLCKPVVVHSLYQHNDARGETRNLY